MTSTITNFSENIDTAYPVAGQDNDTAGFRANFMAIKNSLETAATEITDLQVTQAGFANLSNRVATTSTLGNVKIDGTTIQINNDGVIAASVLYKSTAPLTSKGAPGDIKGMIHATGSYTFVCYASYTVGGIDIWARVPTTGTTW